MQIPEKVRSERLLTDADPIENAKPNSLDANMMLLSKIWFAYIEPHKESSNCPLCLNNIISGFRNLKPALMELEAFKQKMDYL